MEHVQMFEIWSHDSTAVITTVWLKTNADAQRLAYLLDGVAHPCEYGVVVPDETYLK